LIIHGDSERIYPEYAKNPKIKAIRNDVPVPVKYCPRCRTKYNDPPDVCRYCEIPLVEQLPSRTLADYSEEAAWRDDEDYAFAPPDEENSAPGEPAALGEEIEDQKTRVGLLNRYLILRVAWFGAWLLAGFFTAYFITPDDAGEEMKLLIHIAFISAALILANLILKIRVREGPPGPNEHGA